MDLLRFRKKNAYTDLESLKESLPGPEQKEHLEELYALPVKYKTILILHYFEGYSVAEIAQITKLSKSAVKKRLQRGREALKIAITKTCTAGGLTTGNSQNPFIKLTTTKKESYNL